MDVDECEDDGQSNVAGAVMVDSRDLESIMSEPGMTAKIQDLEDCPIGILDEANVVENEGLTLSQSTDGSQKEDLVESISDERFREATSQYLEGACTLADFTAALERCADSQVGGENASIVTEPEEADEAGPSAKRLRLGQVDEGGFNSSMLPPASSWENRPKYTADFYSTGDKVSNFTLRRKRKISPTVQGLMGEAHLRYVRGEQKSAISICQEIIKEQPTLTDPYALLSLIYYDMNEFDRSLRFGMIGALLDPKHCKEWPRLAEMSIEQGNLQQAIACYNHAISISPDVSEYYLRRCELMRTIGDTKGAVRGYHRIIQALPKDGKLCVLAYRKIAQLHYAEKDKEKAFTVLQQAFNDYPNYVTNIEANLILELMRKFKKYVESIQLLQKHSKVEFDPPIRENEFKSRATLTRSLSRRKNVVVPIYFPIELTVRLMTALIHLEANDLVQKILPLLLEKPIEKFGDLYLEIAEAYMAKQQWNSSLKITSLIVKSPNMKEASLCFLRHAETLYSLRKYEEAAKAYETVISLVPNHHVAKLNYALILQKLGRSEDALLTLNQDDQQKVFDHHFIIEKCKIFMQQNRVLELLDSAKFLFSRHCHTLRSKEDAAAMASTNRTDKRYEAVEVYRCRRNEVEDDKRPTFMVKPELLDVEWQIYLHICNICYRMERYDLLQRFTYTAWSSELFGQNPRMEAACGYQAYYATLLNLDMDLVGPYVKQQSLSAEGIATTMALNLFNKALQRQDYVRYGRHLSRLVKRYPNNDSLKMIVAHHNFSCGNYKSALSQYFHLYSKNSRDPLCSLMIVSCLISILSQKTTTNRSQLGIQIIAFIQNYMSARGKCQEMYYNVGRTLQILGVFQEAIQFYKQALEMKPIAETYSGNPVMLPEQNFLPWRSNPLDLRRDILYNLANLYRSTGSPLQARYYLNQLRV